MTEVRMIDKILLNGFKIGTNVVPAETDIIFGRLVLKT
jgi:hypothetical protein